MQYESMFVNGYHYLSSIHPAKKAKCNVNPCLSMLVIDSPSQKDLEQCESMFVKTSHCLSSIHQAKKVKCNVNLRLSILVNDSQIQKA